MILSKTEAKKKFLELINQSNEDENVEFKEAKNDFNIEKIGKYFSALSNEANLKEKHDSWLILGVKDDKSIVGSNFKLENLNELKHLIAEQTNNGLTFKEIYELFIESKRIVMFQIPAALHGIPTAYQGLCYGRDGESLVPLNIEK